MEESEKNSELLDRISRRLTLNSRLFFAFGLFFFASGDDYITVATRMTAWTVMAAMAEIIYASKPDEETV